MALLAEQQFLNILVIVAVFAVIIFALIAFAVFTRYARLWIQSVTTGARIGILDLLGMTFRKVNPEVIVRSKIMATQAGLTDEMGITSKALEAHYLAGGNVPLVIRATNCAPGNQSLSDRRWFAPLPARCGRPGRWPWPT